MSGPAKFYGTCSNCYWCVEKYEDSERYDGIQTVVRLCPYREHTVKSYNSCKRWRSKRPPETRG